MYPFLLFANNFSRVVHPDPGLPKTKSISPGLTHPELLSKIVLRGALCRDSLACWSILNWLSAFSCSTASDGTTLTVRFFQVTPRLRPSAGSFNCTSFIADASLQVSTLVLSDASSPSSSSSRSCWSCTSWDFPDKVRDKRRNMSSPVPVGMLEPHEETLRRRASIIGNVERFDVQGVA
jgi:hypothetical protein